MKLYTTIGLLVGLFQYAACLDHDGWLKIQMDHNIGCDGGFCLRGHISLRSIRSGTPIIDQKNLDSNQIRELKELAQDDGFYSIRTKVTSAESKQTEFLSSVKAQYFLENGLSDVINVWVLPNGDVIAVTFQVTNETQLVEPAANVDNIINSSFYLRYVDQAPVPDTASYIQKLDREREAREKGDVKDNRSFLAKYWMYIVPIAIFVMISGATNPEGGQQAR